MLYIAKIIIYVIILIDDKSKSIFKSQKASACGTNAYRCLFFLCRLLHIKTASFLLLLMLFYRYR